MAGISEKDLKELTAKQYFDQLKEKKQKITDRELVDIYNNCLTLAEKYATTRQTAGLKKLIFHLESLEKEREIIRLGIDTFIYRDDIEEYLDSVKDKSVKLIELERYEREIPDEIVEVINQTKDIFTQMYVVFTDYTGKVERQVVKERREKDPILFATFKDASSRAVVDRFYFLGDWIDEYCDLTLDKMVSQIKSKTGKDVTHPISLPKDIEELKIQLNALEQKNKKNQSGDVEYVVNNDKKKKSFFERVRTFLGGK